MKTKNFIYSSEMKKSNKKQHLLYALILIFLAVFSSCKFENSENEFSRQKLLFNDHWQFQLAENDPVSKEGINESHWKHVQLPHDWSIEGEISEDNPSGHFGGYYPGGVGWYKKSFEYDPSWKNKLVSITFDGVYKDSDVWINDHYLGKRPNGYVSFSYDLSPYLKEGTNTIRVKADNSKQPNARWYTGSGIYRNVWLQIKDKLSVTEWGTYITSENVSTERADINFQSSILNAYPENKSVTISLEIFDAKNQLVSAKSIDKTLSSNDTITIQEKLKVEKPELWSPEHPVLYTAVHRIHENGKVLDEYKTTFGIRSIRFEVETGFWLNDKNIKIKGVNNHQDGGAVGAAVPDDVLRRRMQILKDMGCNAIRTAHNPFSPEFYQMCDEMGFMVMDEVFDEWIASWPWENYQNQGKVPYGYHLEFEKWANRDLTDVILRDRNHPSVIMWSVGNEIPDQCYAEGPERLKPLLELVHTLDDTRPVTAGCCFMHLANDTGFSELLDVAGYNGGGGSVFYEKDKAIYPNRKFIATEIPHSFQTRGVYKTQTDMRSPEQGIAVPNLTKKEVFPEFSEFYSSSYDNSSVRISARDSWRRTDSLPYVAGEFRWTGFDYLGEAIKGWPSRFYNFGIIDLCGFPKDTYYFYKSQWTDEPMVHILPHWTWPGKEGKTIPVWTYSNADEVELFLNGKSLGAKSNKGKMNLSWDVPYTPGEIKAVARTDGKIIKEQIYKTAKKPSKIQVITDKKEVDANGVSCVHLEVNILDEDGNFVPYADNLISFTVDGPAKNLGLENGDPLDLTSNKSNQRKAFNGKCLMILQTTKEAGDIKVTVSSSGLESEEISITSSQSE
ncbi:glycoside hydrolase family 2 TIM barrel-domain containing protein [Mariniflexile sp.]|uniref:glycoside hydrolase family 2 TIM barrel-domain containing protein n=1 Tax=Mariniflexile sp. TaxID=1979402 RepID=UPI00404897E8